MGTPPIISKKVNGVSVNIWAGQYGPNISIDKSYKDKEGKWQRTNFLSVGDAIVAHRLLGDCITFAVRANEQARKPQQQPQQFGFDEMPAPGGLDGAPPAASDEDVPF